MGDVDVCPTRVRQVRPGLDLRQRRSRDRRAPSPTLSPNPVWLWSFHSVLDGEHRTPEIADDRLSELPEQVLKPAFFARHPAADPSGFGPASAEVNEGSISATIIAALPFSCPENVGRVMDEIDELVDWQMSRPPHRRKNCPYCSALYFWGVELCPRCGKELRPRCGKE